MANQDREAGSTSPNNEADTFGDGGGGDANRMTSTPPDDGINSSSTDPLIRFEAENHPHRQSTERITTEESLRRRTPFVSRHRKALNHISADSLQARRHAVPSRAARSSDQDSNGDDNNSTTWWGKWALACREAMAEKGPNDWLGTILPMYVWLKGYPWKTALIQDLVAGLTVGVMIVPQSMSYAKLAGLPVQYGLYSAFVPVFTYSLFGSSRQLAVGPVAIISLLLSTGAAQILNSEGIATEDPVYHTRYAQLAIQLSFLVGVTNILMGMMQMGFVTNFLSHAVISGFTSGASVIIGMSQVKYIFGYDVERSDRFHEVLKNIFENIEEFNYKTFVMGTCGIGVLMLMKHVGKTVPKFKFMRALGPLTVTTFAIILSVAFDFGEESGIPLVGNIPSGFPSFTAIDWFPLQSLDKLFLITISIAIVGFMESIASKFLFVSRVCSQPNTGV